MSEPIPSSSSTADPPAPAAPAARSAEAAGVAAAAAPAEAPAAADGGRTTGWAVALTLVGMLALGAVAAAVYSHQRVRAVEQELVRRQQDSQGQAVEAKALAQQAQEAARTAEAKVALLEARVAETVLQRSQLEELILQLSRSRDENVLADIDAAVRVAMQQSALTGSTEPLAAALRQAEDRLARMNQPRLERVRRALARDIDRVKAVSVTDIAGLTIKLDEAIRSVDELPLLSQPERRAAAPAARPAASAASAPASASAAWQGWLGWLDERSRGALDAIWQEVRSLVRVTRIDEPEAMLIAPEQAWFLRENLKLRLLNARLALLSRQFDTAQADVQQVLAALDRYFDRNARRVVLATELVRQVSQQAKALTLPKPDETLAAIAAAQAGR